MWDTKSVQVEAAHEELRAPLGPWCMVFIGRASLSSSGPLFVDSTLGYSAGSVCGVPMGERSGNEGKKSSRTGGNLE